MRLTPEQAIAFQRETGHDLGVADTGPANPSPARAAGQSGPSGSSRGRGRNPQNELYMHMRLRWGDRVRPDYVGAVPGRKFELDMAFVPERLAIEVDGWQYHGKYKSDFHRDREKRNQLLLNGWGLFTFSARDVLQDPDGCLAMIETVLDRCWSHE